MKQPKPRRRPKNHLADRSRAYRQLWRVVDGAVFDALYTHSDYLTDKGRRSARESIVKRVTGSVLGFAEQSAKGRPTVIVAADRETVRKQPSPARCITAVSKAMALYQSAVAAIFRRSA